MTTSPPPSPYGRWTAVNEPEPGAGGADTLATALALYDANERSSGSTVWPTAALISVTRPDGQLLGVFGADAEDVAVISRAVLTLSDDRYGPMRAEDLTALVENIRQGAWQQPHPTGRCDDDECSRCWNPPG
ncbi:hypothetical protein ACFV8T_44785 [Streptomyces sp. NPDC059832]|uniref:hypothetical protein n=1 Tax=unclassified Streptomyces TaxID=2593676 RepID=UPI0036607F6C